MESLTLLAKLQKLRDLKKRKKKGKRIIFLIDYSNPMEEYDNENFRKRYRFHKDVVKNVLLPMIEPTFSFPDRRGNPIPAITVLLTALAYYATGAIQRMTGDIHDVDQSTVSRKVAIISEIFCSKLPDYIHFPADSSENIKKFKKKAGFPFVVGCIDCTHIYITRPVNDQHAENFRNRKGKFSWNVQVICGPECEMLDIHCRWPGSSHDSRIFQNSYASVRFERGDFNGVLLGDSGYPQTSYLYTPVLRECTAAQNRYNMAQKTTRNTVERCFGIWKRRFGLLGKTIATNKRNTVRAILATAVLHNIALQHNDRGEDFPEDAQVAQPPDVIYNQPNANTGAAIKQMFIAMYFQN